MAFAACNLVLLFTSVLATRPMSSDMARSRSSMMVQSGTGNSTEKSQDAVKIESNLTLEMQATLKASLGRPPPETHWDNFGERPPELPRDWHTGQARRFGSYSREDMLVPTFVTPHGSWYQWRVREQATFVETNEYEWELEAANGQYLGWRVAKLEGSWGSAMFGHQEVMVHNGMHQPQFKIRSSKFVWNPLQRRYSFRILPVWSNDPNDALYTANKDQFGRGLLWLREEWRIYRGRERDNDMVYYCVGSYFGRNWWFYRNKAAYDSGGEPIAQISQKWNAGAFIGGEGGLGEEWGAGLGTWLPDKFKLRVHAGEDSGLLMAVTTIIDIVYDREERSAAANRTRNREKSELEQSETIMEKTDE